MGLQLSYAKTLEYTCIDATTFGQSSTIDQNVTISGCYAKITYISGDKNAINMVVTLYKSYTTQTVLETKNYSFVPTVTDSATNFIKQGYEYLKTLSDFSSASNVLESGQLS
jgi:hypothetical protein